MDKTDRKKRKKESYIKYIFIIVALLAVMISIIVFYYTDMNRQLMDEARSNLKNTNEYKAQYFKQYITGRLDWLRSVAKFCDVPDGSGQENWRSLLDQYRSSDTRLGVADANGIIYYRNEETADIGRHKFYQKVIKGKETISQVFRDGYYGQESIVIAAPIWREGEEGETVQGAVCMEYTTQKLGEILNISDSARERAGATMVFEKDGTLVSSYKGMGYFDTLYDMLKTMKYKEDHAVEGLRLQVADGESGCMAYYNNSRIRLLYFQPLGMEDWFICSLVVPDAEEEVLQQLKSSSTWVLFGVVFLAVLILAAGAQMLRCMKKKERELQMDFLTGSYNRATGKKLVEKSLMSDNDHIYGACMFIDIDNFKQINDAYGHDEGDKILQEVSSVLRECTRDEDVISRYGGDEFSIWLYKISDYSQAEEVAERILKKAAGQSGVGLSIGITLIAKGENDYDAILKRADEALYEAKEKGKNQYVIHGYN